MNDACLELAPLLAAGPLGILDDADRARVDRHLQEGCGECSALASDVLAALGKKKGADLEAPAGVLEAVLARVDGEDLERADAVRTQGPAPVVVLACTYCKGTLTRREAVFCAGCLAPVHEECFLEHGRCVAPGCSETRIVRPSEPALPRRRARAWPLVALVGAGAVAALAGERAIRPAATPAPAPSPSPVAVALAPSPAPVAAPGPSPAAPVPPAVAVSPVPRLVSAPSPSPRAAVSPRPAGEVAWRNAVFLGYEADEEQRPVAVRCEDGLVLPIATDLSAERLRKVRALLLTLVPRGQIMLRVAHGAVVDLTRGHHQALEARSDELAAQLALVREGDDLDLVLVTGLRAEVTATSRAGTGSRQLEARARGKPDAPRLAFALEDLDSLTNLTREAHAKGARPRPDDPDVAPGSEPARPAPSPAPALEAPAADPIARLALQPGDTIRVGFLSGRVESITATSLAVRAWNLDGTWGDVKEFARTSLPPLDRARLRQRRSYPLAAGGPEVVLEIDRIHDSTRTPALTVRAAIWHDAKDVAVTGALLTFVATAADGKGTFLAREEIPVDDVFPGDRIVLEQPFEDPRGGVADVDATLELSPAKNAVAARAPGSTALALRALAARRERGPVWTFLAAGGDPDVALFAASERIRLPEDATLSEKHPLDEAIAALGSRFVDAVARHVATSDATFRLPELQPDGRIEWRPESAQAVARKRAELALIGPQQEVGAESIRRLLDVYVERGTELGEAIQAVFASHSRATIQGMLAILAGTGDASSDDARRRADVAGDVVRRLGRPGLDALLEELAARGSQGRIQSRKLRATLPAEGAANEAELVRNATLLALGSLVEATRSELRASLAQKAAEARVLAAEGKWREAHARVALVRESDPSDAETAALLASVLAGEAGEELAAGRRGAAAQLLEGALAADARNAPAGAALGRILVEAAREEASGVLLREGPSETTAAVRSVSANDPYRIAHVREPVTSWIPVVVAGRTEPAWIHQDVVVATDGGTGIQVSRASAPPARIRELLERATRLAPELGPAADAIDGDLWLREAEALDGQGRPAQALAYYERASRLVPADPRLSRAFWCRLRVNAALLLLLGGAGLGAGVGLPVWLALARRRARLGGMGKGGGGKAGK